MAVFPTPEEARAGMVRGNELGKARVELDQHIRTGHGDGSDISRIYEPLNEEERKIIKRELLESNWCVKEQRMYDEAQGNRTWTKWTLHSRDLQSS